MKTMPSILSLLTALLAVGGTFLRARAASPPPEELPRLFAPVENRGLAAAADAPSQPRPASIQRQLNPALSAASPAPALWTAGQRFHLELPDQQEITFEVESVEPTVEGGLVIHGQAPAQDDSSGTLSLEGQELTGLLDLPGRGRYQIVPLAEPGQHEVRRLEARRPQSCATGEFTASALASAQQEAAAFQPAAALPAANTLSEPAVVEVLFVYTSQAVIGEGSEEGIRQRISESVDDTNRRLRISEINVVIHPVHITKVNYAESGDMYTDVARLARGEVAGVNGLRADYKADLVVLITEWENAGIGGIANDVPPHTGNSGAAFNVIRRTALGGRKDLLAHELGHLLGCVHDREHSSDIGSRKPYVYAHRLVVEGVTYVTLMGYQPGIALDQYSNPNLNLDGVPLGVPSGGAKPADGARTINEIAPYVARYRQALSRISFSAKRATAVENAGSVTLELVRTGDLNTSTRVSVIVETDSTAKAGLDFDWASRTQVEFATNQASAELVIPLLADDLVEDRETLRLRLASVVGNHGLGGQGTAEVVIVDSGTHTSWSEVEFPAASPRAVPESAGTVRIQAAYTGSFPAQPAEPILLPWRTEDGTAVAGLDFQAASGTLAFTPEAAVQEIAVQVLPRPEAGPDRTLRLIVGAKTNELRIVDEQRPGALVSVPGAGLRSGVNAAVRGDGKLLVWGGFARLGETERTGLALLNADGSVDPSFRPPEFLLGHRRIETAGRRHPNAIISTVLVLPDDRMLVAGVFSRVAGQTRISFVRLQPDGSLDESFGPGLTFDGSIDALARQADGKILIGGDFEKINGVRRPFIWRLNEDGTVDDTFKPKGGPTSGWTAWIAAIVLQPDGRILFGGNFDKVDGKPAVNLARLNPDGTLDTSFKLPAAGVSGPVEFIRLQPDGRIVLAGLFDTVSGRANTRKLARLHPNGTVDTTFRSPNPNNYIASLENLPDGRLLVSGPFTVIGGQNRRFVARLLADGSVDPGFDLGTGPDGLPGPSEGHPGSSLSVHADGTFYLAGSFQHINGLPAANLARIRFGAAAPALGAAVQDPSGQLRSAVHGLPGGVYGLESSATLNHWDPAGEVRLKNYDKTAEFAVPATAAEHRFFRLKTASP